MKTFVNLLDDYEADVISFDELIAATSELTWATKVVEDDGSVDWVGDNFVADIYNAHTTGVLTEDEIAAILLTVQ